MGRELLKNVKKLRKCSVSRTWLGFCGKIRHIKDKEQKL